jgi:hypothetical protein
MAMATATATDKDVKEVKRSFLREGRRAEESSEWITGRTSINFVSAIKLRRLNIK